MGSGLHSSPGRYPAPDSGSGWIEMSAFSFQSGVGARYRELGDKGLTSRRCGPHNHPNKTPEEQRAMYEKV